MILENADPRYFNQTKIDVVTEPTTEPVSVAEFKIFARIDNDDEDSALSLMLKGAREAAEKYLGRALITQTIYYTMNKWTGRSVELPYPPLQSVSGIYTRQTDGTWEEYSSDYYFIETYGVPGRIILKDSASEPSADTVDDIDSYQIRYVAGYGDNATDVPSAIRQAILVWANVAYATRAITVDPPPEVRSSLSLFRIERLK